jgi:hypothetical protein
MIFPGLSYSPIRYFPRKNQNYGYDYDKGIEFFKSLYMSRVKDRHIYDIYFQVICALDAEDVLELETQ